MERVNDSDEKMLSAEKELYTKYELMQASQKKYEDQINKLTKILKEKESYYSKQKDSLVSYYEQLLNDVNSRVKVNMILKIVLYSTNINASVIE